MSAPYSNDLRHKAIAAVKRGERKTDVCKMFQISRNTLDLWLKQDAETGNCEAITDYERGRPQKIMDWERFEAFVEDNEGKTQKELARLWGDNVSQQNISAALKKLGGSRKQQANGNLKRDTVKRQAIKAGLKAQPAALIDGADMRTSYLYPCHGAPGSCPQSKRMSSERLLDCPQAVHSSCSETNCPFIKENLPRDN